MGTTERRARARIALKQKILDAARALFIEEGYDAVTMRRIAQRIEYSPTAIYLHFDDKDTLMRAVCDETFEKLARRLDRLAASEADPLARLREGLHVYVDFALKHPHHYTATFLLKTRGDKPPFDQSAGGRAFSHLQRAVENAVAHGALGADNPAATAQALWAVVHGLSMLLISVNPRRFPFVPRATLVDTAIDAALRGLAR